MGITACSPQFAWGCASWDWWGSACAPLSTPASFFAWVCMVNSTDTGTIHGSLDWGRQEQQNMFAAYSFGGKNTVLIKYFPSAVVPVLHWMLDVSA